MLQWLEIEGIPPLNNVRIEFGERLTMITGDNGLGKSVILDAVHWMLTGVWPNEPIMPPGDARIAISVGSDASERARRVGGVVTERTTSHAQGNWQPEKLDVLSPRSNLGPFRVLTVLTDGTSSIWDPGRPGNVASEFGYFTTSFRIPRFEVWFGSGNHEVRVCNGLIDDLVRWEATRPTVFAAMQKLVEDLSPPGEPMKLQGSRRLRLGNARMFPLVTTPFGRFPITHLSNGMQRILALAYMIVWALDPDSDEDQFSPSEPLIVIIDEIDIHLHPKWQRSILSSILEGIAALLPTATIQVVATAHAPMVLAGFEAAADPKRDRIATLDFSQETKAATIHTHPWEKLGTVDEWLTSSAFGLTDTGSIEREEAIAKAEAFLDQPSRSAEAQTAIEQNLKAALPGADPFWEEWRWGLRERGG